VITLPANVPAALSAYLIPNLDMLSLEIQASIIIGLYEYGNPTLEKYMQNYAYALHDTERKYSHQNVQMPYIK
jgi:hypothetical protein